MRTIILTPHHFGLLAKGVMSEAENVMDMEHPPVSVESLRRVLDQIAKTEKSDCATLTIDEDDLFTLEGCFEVSCEGGINEDVADEDRFIIQDALAA